MRVLSPAFVVAAVLLPLASAQTFQRLGACPTLGCIRTLDNAAKGMIPRPAKVYS
ncbi:hypothetical protein BDN71DRAFT_1445997 [Pleurotus eryngii]|uniref:Uncharacterized protein n=1 Tax=Pleurotus eryngii TaxID=5323 RepID=A0A9P6A1X3_PLEER|nr:hypothetical protein BDN71DRAFT_1445997 [Pleurotus eryngii]